MASANKIGWQKVSHVEMPGKQGIMQESETQLFPLGRLIALDDGRKFRYSKAGGVALAAGKMTGSPLVATERDDTVNGGVAISRNATSFTQTAVGTITENQFKDGFACMVSDTGLGLQYKIKGNTAASGTAETIVSLYDPIVTPTGTTTSCILVLSPWTGLIITPDDVIMATGVPTVPVTESYYFWSQTGGMAMCLMGSSTGVATDERTLKIDVAANVDGALDSTAGITTTGLQIVGIHAFDSTDCVDTDYWPVWLTID